MPYTPSPWSFGPGNMIFAKGGKDRSVHSLAVLVSGELPTSEINANGHLIEATPDIYEAALGVLRAADEASGMWTPLKEPLERLRAACDKAEPEREFIPSHENIEPPLVEPDQSKRVSLRRDPSAPHPNDPRQLIPGHRYRIRSRIDGVQRVDRESVLDFMGFSRSSLARYDENVTDGDEYQFSARPLAGTQTVDLRHIISIEEVNKTSTPISLGKKVK